MAKPEALSPPEEEASRALVVAWAREVFARAVDGVLGHAYDLLRKEEYPHDR